MYHACILPSLYLKHPVESGWVNKVGQNCTILYSYIGGMFYSQVYEFAVGPFATHDVFLLIIKYYVLLERQFKTGATYD